MHHLEEASTSTRACHRLLWASSNNAGALLHRSGFLTDALPAYNGAINIQIRALRAAAAPPSDPSSSTTTPRTGDDDVEVDPELLSVCRDALEAEENLIRSAPPSSLLSSFPLPVRLFRDCEADAIFRRDDDGGGDGFEFANPILVDKSASPASDAEGFDAKRSAVTLYNVGLLHRRTERSSTGGTNSSLFFRLALSSATSGDPVDGTSRSRSALEGRDYGSVAVATSERRRAEEASSVPGAGAPSEATEDDVSILALNALAVARLEAGDPNEALSLLNEAYVDVASRVAPDEGRDPAGDDGNDEGRRSSASDEAAMTTLSNLSHAHRRLGQNDESIEASEACLRMLEGWEQSFEEGRAVLLHNIAASHCSSRDTDAALRCYSSLLSLIDDGNVNNNSSAADDPAADDTDNPTADIDADAAANNNSSAADHDGSDDPAVDNADSRAVDIADDPAADADAAAAAADPPVAASSELLQLLEVDAHRRIGLVRADLDDPTRAVPAFVRSIRTHLHHRRGGTTSSVHPPFLTAASVGLAGVRLSSGHARPAVDLLGQSLLFARGGEDESSREGGGPSSRPSLLQIREVTILRTLGRAHRVDGDDDSAIRCFAEATDVVRRLLLPNALRVHPPRSSREQQNNDVRERSLTELLNFVKIVLGECRNDARAVLPRTVAILLEWEVASDECNVVNEVLNFVLSIDRDAASPAA